MKDDTSIRQFLLLGVIGGIIFACCIAPIIIVATVDSNENDQRLAKFSDNLFAYRLPPQTEVVSKRTKVGLLEGNGNHCDFLAELTLSSALGLDELKTYYEKVEFPNADVDGLFPIRARVRIDTQKDN